MSGPIFMEFCKTERGGEMLIFDGHLHIKEKSYKDKTVWRCQEWYKLKCQGRVHLSENLKVMKMLRHNHTPNTEKVVVAKILTAIKEKALGTNLATKDVVDEVMATMPKVVSAKVPCLKSLKRMVQRIRSQTTSRHSNDGNDTRMITEELTVEPEMPAVTETSFNTIKLKMGSFEPTCQSPTQELDVEDDDDYNEDQCDMKDDEEEDSIRATDDIITIKNEDKESETRDNNANNGNNDKDRIEQRTSAKKEKPTMERNTPRSSRRPTMKKTIDRLNTSERFNAGKIGNEFDIFGRSIAVQLSNMPLEVAVELQMSIQTLICQARLNYLRERSSTQENSVTNLQDLERTLTTTASVCSSPESDNDANDSEC